MDLLWHHGCREALKTPLHVGVTLYLLGSQQLASVVSEDLGCGQQSSMQRAGTGRGQRGFAGEKGERRGLGGSWPPTASGLSMRKTRDSFREQKRASA